jgi:hypothetical protein
LVAEGDVGFGAIEAALDSGLFFKSGPV